MITFGDGIVAANTLSKCLGLGRVQFGEVQLNSRGLIGTSVDVPINPRGLIGTFCGSGGVLALALAVQVEITFSGAISAANTSMNC